jgi:hypothetical protein
MPKASRAKSVLVAEMVDRWRGQTLRSFGSRRYPGNVLMRFCLDVSLGATHHCTETNFIIRGIFRVKSDSGAHHCFAVEDLWPCQTLEGVGLSLGKIREGVSRLHGLSKTNVLFIH